MVMPDTAIVVHVNAEVRDPGHKVWTCHTAEIATTVSGLQALLVALGHSDMYTDASDLVRALIAGDLFESGTLVYEEGNDRNVSIEITLGAG